MAGRLPDYRPTMAEAILAANELLADQEDGA